ncbi:MAG TPA: hypothetical protein VJQ56_15580, partial [Blastocatellia bacterium]|nr:hypothetical protein [Blastocatellia bacterium]
MKGFTLTFLTIVALAIVCAAQDSGSVQDSRSGQDPTDLIVIKLGWEKRQLPEGWDRADPVQSGSDRVNDDLRIPPQDDGDITELATQRKMGKRGESNSGQKEKTPASRLPDRPDQ